MLFVLEVKCECYRAASRLSSVQPCRQLIEYTSNVLRRNRRLVIEAWTRKMTPGISYFSAANSNADISSMVARAQPTSIPTQQTMRNMVPTTRVGSSNWMISSSSSWPCGKGNIVLKKPDAIRRVIEGTLNRAPSADEWVTASLNWKSGWNWST